MDWSTTDLVVFWAVVAIRFLLPLSIPVLPLPGILACLVVDAFDQSVFQTFTDIDLADYQSYDKALDIFYLSVAMLATYRNWASRRAVHIGRALFYLRLMGVMGFELTGWRPMLLLLPNAFEYFFILYEVIRSRWYPARLSTRFYVGAAAMIWFVKLPQEYWIHIARLDFSDELKRVVFGAPVSTPWPAAVKQRPLGVGLLLVSAGALWLAAREAIHRFVRPPAHKRTLAAAPVPSRIDEAHERDRSIARRWRLFDYRMAEKIVLVGFITVIFAQIVPGVRAGNTQLVLGTAVIVTINTFLRLRRAARRRSLESATLSFVLLVLSNAIIVELAERLLDLGGGALDVRTSTFFLLLLSLVVTLYDLWRPIFDERFARPARRPRKTTTATR